MHEKDFDREIKAALDDIVDTAPKPPKWQWLTGGYAPLTRYEPTPWYRRGGAAFLGAAAVAVAVVGIAAFIGSGLGEGEGDSVTSGTTRVSQSAESLHGIWVLESYTVAEETVSAPFSEGGQPKPWIEFSADGVRGVTDCYVLASSEPSRVVDGKLLWGHLEIEHENCFDWERASAVVALMWETPSADIEITATSFQVNTPEATLVFTRVDWPPTENLTQWPVKADDLACEGGAALDHRLTDDSLTVTDMLLAVPNVAEVVERGEFEDSLGYDAQGNVVAALTAGDTSPREYYRRSCASLWGLRPVTSQLHGAVLTWVNNVGINQQSPRVWSDRFVEMCGTNTADLATLAERYVEHDAPLANRAGGDLPSIDEATQTLEIIWRMTCAASSFEEPPPTPDPAGAQASCGSTSFDLRYTEGPELTKDEFLDTTQGQILEAFFIGGEGEPENHNYLASDGFSIVDSEFILGYTDGRITSEFNLHEDSIRGWGGCRPKLTTDDLSSERFIVAGPIEPSATTIPLKVQGGACSAEDGYHVTTEVVEVDVTETANSVLITVWKRGIPPPWADEDGNYMCAGVGIEIDAEAALSAPIGDREILDAGQLPPASVEIRGPAVSIKPEICSTEGLATESLEDYQPSYEGLPDELESFDEGGPALTRFALYSAALSCDLEQIVALALLGGNGEFNDGVFWGAANDPDSLAWYDGEHQSLRRLVLALTTLPYESFEGQRLEAEDVVPVTIYQWPAPVDLADGQSISDVWSDDMLNRVAAVNDWTVNELIGYTDEFGAYAGFRVGIAEDGTWMYALAGD
ncbi:MAG: hypothetical protein ABFR95_04655 [Actinomycetota bacterium]